ncbi:MAG: TerD family protein, partial [Candidatus Competibacteraceae bacterium]
MTSTALQKGGNIGLNKVAPGITHINVALGWIPRDTPGMEVDGSAFLLTADGKVRGDQDLVFYNNPRSTEGSVQVITESARLDAQDSQLFALNLGAMPDAIQKIAFTVTIHEGQERQQNFGMLRSAWARVVNPDGQSELARFELPLAGTPETAMIFCEVYRHSGEWKFRAVGQGYVGGLEPLAISYGIDVAEDSAEASVAPTQPPAASIPPPALASATAEPPPSPTPPPAEPAPPPAL